MSERPNTIEAEGLVREFKKGPRAVDGVDLHVSPGEIYGFLGPNGAGKSTTVLMLTTLLPPTAGTARVGGFDVVKQGPQVRKAIGAALQEAALDPLLTGREHLRLQTAMHGIRGEERKRRSDQLLDRVGLSEAADRKVKGYSGGMKRRLDLALALVHRPRVLFLDEPTTGLDPQSRAALWEEVARLARDEGVTVFLTTQYLEEADVLSDRVGIIDHGRIVGEGTPAQLKAEIALPTVEVVPADQADAPEVERLLAQFGERTQGSPRSVAVRCLAGADLARDIQTGFLNRLALTPLRGAALVAGNLASVVAMGFVQAVVYLSVGLAVGVHLKSGVGGAFVLLLLATVIAVSFGALGAFLALRTGSGESIQSLFPVIFTALFVSSMNTPRNLIRITWFRDVATANPVSYLIEGIRSLIITGWDGEALALAFSIAIGMAVVSLALAAWALKGRLTRT